MLVQVGYSDLILDKILSFYPELREEDIKCNGEDERGNIIYRKRDIYSDGKLLAIVVPNVENNCYDINIPV
ncbi:MAG: hypothetical protein WC877_01870 [Dehalococcoidales bacterium]|jgi:hypothetical protein